MARISESRKPPQPRHGSAFCQSIKVGDLVVAYSPGSPSRYHLVQVRELAYEEDERQGEPDKYGGFYDFSNCYSGVALCGSDGSRVAWGNRSRYYWQLRERSLAELLGDDMPCKKCWAALKREQKASTKFGHEARWRVRQPSDVAAEYPPPFGWRELPPAGHPYDVAPGADPELVVDAKTGEVHGERRTELRRWQRGHRIVRIVERYAEDRHEVLVSNADAPKDEEWKYRGTPAQVRRRAQEIMALGGNS